MTDPRILSQVHVCCECGRMYAAGFQGLRFSTKTEPPEWVQEQFENRGAWVVNAPNDACECGCEWFERGSVHDPRSYDEYDADEDNFPGFVGEGP